MSIEGKSGRDSGKVRTRETNENEPSIKRRKGIQSDIETNDFRFYWEKSVGYLGSEQTVSGVVCRRQLQKRWRRARRSRLPKSRLQTTASDCC